MNHFILFHKFLEQRRGKWYNASGNVSRGCTPSCEINCIELSLQIFVKGFYAFLHYNFLVITGLFVCCMSCVGCNDLFWVVLMMLLQFKSLGALNWKSEGKQLENPRKTIRNSKIRQKKKSPFCQKLKTFWGFRKGKVIIISGDRMRWEDQLINHPVGR